MSAYSLRWVVLALLPWVFPPAQAAEFTISTVETRLDGNIYRLDARVDYRFSDTALEALDNGVPLTLEVRFRIRRDGAWIWESSLVDKKRLYLIRFQPLTEQYLVVRLPDGIKKRFVTRDAALAALGELDDLDLVRSDRLDPKKQYLVHLKVSLDIEALPLPLRPRAYLMPSWKISSGWSRWPLNP